MKPRRPRELRQLLTGIYNQGSSHVVCLMTRWHHRSRGQMRTRQAYSHFYFAYLYILFYKYSTKSNVHINKLLLTLISVLFNFIFTSNVARSMVARCDPRERALLPSRTPRKIYHRVDNGDYYWLPVLI